MTTSWYSVRSLPPRYSLVARLNWVTGVMRRNVYSVLQTGHAAGDHALLSLAARLLSSSRKRSPLSERLFVDRDWQNPNRFGLEPCAF